MTDNKENIASNSGSIGESSGETSSKRARSRFHSQLSNISFASFAESLATGNGSIPSSSVAFPRVSLRSILMNSPFSRHTKPRRGCNKTSAAKSMTGTPEKVCLTPSESGSSQKSSLKRQTGSSSLRRSSINCSKSPPPEASMPKINPCIDNLYQFPHLDTRASPSIPSPTLPTVLKTNLSEPSTSSAGRMKECSLCLQELEEDKFPILLTCNHTSCLSCMKQYLIVEITESRINISCPQCNLLMHPTDIHLILNNSILSYKYEDFMLRRVLSMDPDTRWCPAPDCGYAVIASGCASCPKLKCERIGCESYFCYHCKAEWHPNQTCDMARAQRSPNAPISSFSYLHDLQNNDDVKSCPRCQVLIVKMDDGSCNHITCSVCSAEFCWLCMKEISDLHYLSPSGCTFWGKKPWSRKKKIMWQLGTLVGAPLGIGLVAGLAVPAMIIGIPIWVGKKLHSRYATRGKHRRNLAMVGGVTASALVSPVLAGLAVSIGVPILLAYVYGVVPISLCRSGGCGVTTSASGVRINFDDENDMIIGIPGARSDTQPSAANPSIGEVSCGVSLSAESAAHLLSESDRESASNTAIAPASLTGSIASSCLSRSHRLEIQADIVHGNRSVASFDSRATDVENSSIKALAGSLLRYKVTEADESEAEMDEMRLDSVSAILTHRQTLATEAPSNNCIEAPSSASNCIEVPYSASNCIEVSYSASNCIEAPYSVSNYIEAPSSASNCVVLVEGAGGIHAPSSDCVVLEMEEDQILAQLPNPLRRSVSVASCAHSPSLPMRSQSVSKLDAYL